jgi:hypothetical protein
MGFAPPPHGGFAFIAAPPRRQHLQRTLTQDERKLQDHIVARC